MGSKGACISFEVWLNKSLMASKPLPLRLGISGAFGFVISKIIILAQPTNPVECVQSLTQKHVAKWYMIAEKLLPLHHES
jgi:hypothetical protein